MGEGYSVPIIRRCKGVGTLVRKCGAADVMLQLMGESSPLPCQKMRVVLLSNMTKICIDFEQMGWG